MFKNSLTMSQLHQSRKEWLQQESINPRSSGISLRGWLESSQAEQELDSGILHFMVNSNHPAAVISSSSSSCILSAGNSAVAFFVCVFWEGWKVFFLFDFIHLTSLPKFLGWVLQMDKSTSMLLRARHLSLRKVDFPLIFLV